MISRSELRARARQTLGGKIFGNQWLFPLLVALIINAVTAFAGGTFVLVIVLTGSIMVGSAAYYVGIVRGNKADDLNPLLDGVKEDFGGNLVAGLLVTLFTFLWSLLFIIPGIVKSYSYAMTYFIKKDNPGMTGQQAITESRKMMKGYKWKLFMLDLSFIGWYIVGALCLGIGTLWVTPYHQTAKAHFYEELKGTPVVEAASAE
ncbi:MAG: DUF975 family protein [Clostridia bacterium]|nr:DUF975 family protein [Clostridia bacterium]